VPLAKARPAHATSAHEPLGDTGDCASLKAHCLCLASSRGMQSWFALHLSNPFLLCFLQDFRDEIKEDACRAQVRKYQELAAQDIRFNPRLADACFQDRMDLCAHVPPVSATACIRRTCAHWQSCSGQPAA
jgi:hypothetical protein